jgi:hypothetical protein
MVSVNRSAKGCSTRVIGCRGGRPEARSHGRRARTPVAPRAAPIFFSCLSTQQVKRQVKNPRPGDWLAGAAMLLAVASWGVLAVVLAG